MKLRFVDLIFFLLLLVTSFDPTGYYTSYLNIVLFAVLVCYGFLNMAILCQNKIIQTNAQIVFSLVFLPFWGISIAIICGTLSDDGYAVSHLTSMLYILLYLYTRTADIRILLKCMWVDGIVLAVASLLMLAVSQYFDFELIYSLRLENSNFLMAKDRNFLGIEISGVYFRTGPWIMFAFVYHLYKYRGPWKFFISCILYLALALSGSRTPFIMQTLILIVYLYDSELFGKRSSKIVALAAIIGVIFITYKLVTQKDEYSNALKFDNAISYVEDILAKGHILIGAGVGSVFFAKGNGEYLSFSELSYFDLWRMYGIVLGTYFALMFFLPALKCWLFNRGSLFLRRFMLAYVLFLILAGTNPLLLGVIGIIPLIITMSIYKTVVTTKDCKILEFLK